MVNLGQVVKGDDVLFALEVLRWQPVKVELLLLDRVSLVFDHLLCVCLARLCLTDVTNIILYLIISF